MNTDELSRVHTNFKLASGAAVLILSGGTIFYHFIEKLSWVDALYFSIITLATVGYGDIVPHTTAGKLFTCLYVIVGIAIIGTFGNLLIKQSLLKRELRQQKKNKN